MTNTNTDEEKDKDNVNDNVNDKDNVSLIGGTLSKGSISGMDSQVGLVTKVRTSKPPHLGSALIPVHCVIGAPPRQINGAAECQKVARIMNSPSSGWRWWRENCLVSFYQDSPLPPN